jgi:anti-sigma B factor antagonist
MRDCTIRQETRDDLDIVHLEGALDFRTFPRLESVVQELMAKGRYRVVFDCLNLHYMSSATLGSLVAFTRQARQEGGDLKLAAVPEDIMAIIRLLGFDTVLDIQPDAEAAAQAFTG